MAKRYRSHEPGARRSPVELRLVRVVFEPDPDASEKYLEGLDELKERLAEYKRGDWNFVCVRAVAEVTIDGIVQTLKSGGVYAIESDSEDEFLEELVIDEWKALRGILKTVGVPTSELPVEVDRSWVEWRM